MAFPTNPTKGDTYISDDTTWTFNGVDWRRTLIGANNSTSYRFGELGLTSLLTRVSDLETQLATLQSTDNLIL